MFLPYLLVFVFGAIIGSFLNVVIARNGKDLGGRSRCPKCAAPLLWFELIPILSFFWARGRCRHCGGAISWQYPIVETLTGFLFVAVFAKYGFMPLSFLEIFVTLAFFAILIVVALRDFYDQEIPNLVYAAIALAFASVFLDFSWLRILAGPLLALPFSLLFFGSRGRLIGFGDAKIALALGWFFGLEAGIVAILLAFWLGAVYALILLLARRQKFTMKTAVPFAPFMFLGALLAFIFSLDFAWLFTIFTL
jgi:prepilin signal peptidase PulO-like enzyme (type II secretory pathway)